MNWSRVFSFAQGAEVLLESKLKRTPGTFQLLVDYGKQYFFMDELKAALLDIGPAGGAAPAPLSTGGQKKQRKDGDDGGSHSGKVGAPAGQAVPPRFESVFRYAYHNYSHMEKQVCPTISCKWCAKSYTPRIRGGVVALDRTANR